MTVAVELVGLTGTDHRPESLFYSINLSGWFRKKTERNRCHFVMHLPLWASRKRVSFFYCGSSVSEFMTQICKIQEVWEDAPNCGSHDKNGHSLYVILFMLKRSHQHVFLCNLLFDAFQELCLPMHTTLNGQLLVCCTVCLHANEANRTEITATLFIKSLIYSRVHYVFLKMFSNLSTTSCIQFIVHKWNMYTLDQEHSSWVSSPAITLST